MQAQTCPETILRNACLLAGTSSSKRSKGLLAVSGRCFHASSTRPSGARWHTLEPGDSTAQDHAQLTAVSSAKVSSECPGPADQNTVPFSKLHLKPPRNHANPDDGRSGKSICKLHGSEASSQAPPVTFANLAALPASRRFQAARAGSEPQPIDAHGGAEPHVVPLRPSTPTRPPSLTIASEPSSLANLSPSLLRTPPTSRPDGPPSHVRQDVLPDGTEFSTPDNTLGTSLLTCGTQLWAPCRALSPTRSRLLSHRRFSESPSECGSPRMHSDLPSPPWQQCLRLSMHGGYSSDDAPESGGNRLVCNLVERFNNAQLYDGISASP